MKQDIQRIMLAAAKPLFLIFILYILKIMEVGMDWDFSRLGVYPMEKRGLTGILTHPLIHSGFSHLLANTIPLFFLSWCLFYFYRGIAGKIFIPDRKTGMAHRCQRTDLWLCLLSLFQWYSPQICSTHCHLFTCHLFIWRNYMAYVSLFLPYQYVMGRTS